MEIKVKRTSCDTSKLIKELDALPDFAILSWTEQDDELIRKYYPRKGSKIGKVLGRTKQQIYKRAVYLGVRCEGITPKKK